MFFGEFVTENIILKNDKIRIFRPWEVTRLINGIPKLDYKVKFEVLLYTGARYSEIKRLYDNPRWFLGNSIKMPNPKALKRHKERFILLNPQGQRAVNHYLFRCKKGLPHYVTWDENLKRWCKQAGIDPTGVSIKSTRKTWESWLVKSYPEKLPHIFLSQGHTQMTALEYYLNIPFTEGDLREMKPYVDGWG